MNKPASKKKAATPARSSQMPASLSKSTPASRLRVQTRKLLGKHYRAKYGVR